MSKLTYHDMKKFLALVKDVFPNIRSYDIVYERLVVEIKEVLN